MPTLDVLTLDGWRLDYYTGQALGYEMLVSNDGAGPAYRADRTNSAFTPTLDPRDLMPALKKMDTVLHLVRRGVWHARAAGRTVCGEGPTVDTAVCRALVMSVLGVTVPSLGVGAGVGAGCEDLFA